MTNGFGIRPDYAPRAAPEYDDQHSPGSVLVYQPDVYRDARRFAQHLGARTIIDIGTGNGRKLLDAARSLDSIGLDFGLNIERNTARYPNHDWRVYDADGTAPLPLSLDELDSAVLVCADVIEHVVHPDRLLGTIRTALERAPLAIISTPDREKLFGPGDLGPPGNPFHIREWTRAEFLTFLRDCGIEHAAVRYTREHDQRHDCRTIEAIISTQSLVVAGVAIGPGVRETKTDVPLRLRAGAICRRATSIARRQLSR